MAHNRKLALSGVALTMARIPAKRSIAAMTMVRDELEPEVIQSGFLHGAPFKWIGLIIREGLVNETKPHYEKVNAKYGDLPLAIEIDVHRLLNVSEGEMAAVYRQATLMALVHAGNKYGLNVTRLKELLRRGESEVEAL